MNKLTYQDAAAAIEKNNDLVAVIEYGIPELFDSFDDATDYLVYDEDKMDALELGYIQIIDRFNYEHWLD